MKNKRRQANISRTFERKIKLTEKAKMKSIFQDVNLKHLAR